MLCVTSKRVRWSCGEKIWKKGIWAKESLETTLVYWFKVRNLTFRAEDVASKTIPRTPMMAATPVVLSPKTFPFHIRMPPVNANRIPNTNSILFIAAILRIIDLLSLAVPLPEYTGHGARWKRRFNIYGQRRATLDAIRQSRIAPFLSFEPLLALARA